MTSSVGIAIRLTRPPDQLILDLTFRFKLIMPGFCCWGINPSISMLHSSLTWPGPPSTLLHRCIDSPNCHLLSYYAPSRCLLHSCLDYVFTCLCRCTSLAPAGFCRSCEHSACTNSFSLSTSWCNSWTRLYAHVTTGFKLSVHIISLIIDLSVPRPSGIRPVWCKLNMGSMARTALCHYVRYSLECSVHLKLESRA